MRKSLIALSLSLAATPALAAGGTDYAKVTRVEPITRTVEINEPREECWYETVRYRDRSDGNGTAGLVLGGIAGGVLGNQVGGGNGRKVATVAGTILGAGVGQEFARRGRDRGPEYRRERRCETVHETRYEQRNIGYDVHYRYHGSEYVTRMDRHPGDRIRVRVDVTPLE
ncbi:MAG: glycine zipper 2TM domain-containing protein [Arhodomonas sp.]|nr:glycine zipper 2TM domain-containing protein [Arhodomonas sp.]